MPIESPKFEEATEILADVVREFPGRGDLRSFLSVSWVISNCLLFRTALVLFHGNEGAGKTRRSDS